MTGSRWMRLAAVVLAAGVLGVPGAAAAAPAGPGAVSADGADLMTVVPDGGDLDVTFRAPGSPDGVDPATVVLGGDGGVAGRIPDESAFAFLGAAGTPVWSLSTGGAHFPALDTSGVRAAVELRLSSFSGPGSFAAYTVSDWGRPAVLLDSRERTGTRLPGGRRIAGVAWTFDTPGEYRLGFRLRSGTAEGEATYRVSVPEFSAPPEAVPSETAPSTPPEVASQAAPLRAAPPAALPRTAASAAAPSAAAARNTTAAARKVVSDGHVDMGPNLEGTRFVIRIKDDTVTPAVWREMADVVLKFTDKAKIEVPSSAGYAFLGKAGDTVWLSPQSQQSGIVWPGWNTQHESVVKGTRGNVTWRLRGVSGPGQFKLFTSGGFEGPKVLFDSAKSLPQQLSIPPNSHVHGNWAFTEPGLYRLAVEMSGTTTAGKTVSDTKTLTIAVGDATDAEAGFGAGGGSGSSATGGNLARTGANLTGVLAGGSGLLVTGIVLFAAARRKR